MKLVRVFFLRHGKTPYGGIFPDLTDEGKSEIEKTAEYIYEVIGDEKNIRIVSSPLPRALGTADIIAKKLGYPFEKIEQELAIRSMDFYDADAANLLWKSFPTARHVDHAYSRDPQFDTGLVVEKRSAIQRRFYTYLGNLFEEFSIGNTPDVVIHTSHYEVLWAFAAAFGFEEPLIHGEVIKLELTASANEGQIHVRSTFREHSREFDVELSELLFLEQFC